MILGKSNSDALYLRREYATGRYTFQTFNGGNDGSIALQPFGGKVGIASAIPTSTLDVNGDVRVGSGITLSPDGDGFYTGIVTATSFVGDGSALTGIANTSVIFTDKVSLGDDEHINVGLGSDLQLYHNGSNSYIDNSTGITFIRNTGTNGSQIQLLNNYSGFKIQALAGEQSILGVANGQVELYHNNLKKFETTNTGAVVTGILTATTGTFTTGVTTSLRSNKISLGDNEFINVGLGSDLQIYHNPNSSYIDNNTGHLFIRNNVDNDDGGNIYIQAKSGEQGIIINDDGAVQIYHDNSQKLVTSSTGVTVTGTVVATSFTGDLTGDVTGSISGGTIAGSTGTFTGDVDIADKIVHTGDTDTAIRFPDADTITAETGGSERVRIASDGKVGIGQATPAGQLHISSGTSGDCELIIEADTDNNDENDNPRILLDKMVGMTNQWLEWMIII